MAAATSIVLADGQTTPVNVTFAVDNVAPGVAKFSDRSTGIAAFFRRLTVAYSGASSQRKTARASYDVAMPVTASVNGVTMVVRTLRAKVEFIIPDESTDAERKDLHAFVANGLANSLIRGNLRDLDPIY